MRRTDCNSSLIFCKTNEGNQSDSEDDEESLYTILQEGSNMMQSLIFFIDEIRELIQEKLRGPACVGGYRSIWHFLRISGYQLSSISTCTYGDICFTHMKIPSFFPSTNLFTYLLQATSFFV